MMPASPVVANATPSIVELVTALVFPTTSGDVPPVPTANKMLFVPPSEFALSARPVAFGAPAKFDHA